VHPIKVKANKLDTLIGYRQQGMLGLVMRANFYASIVVPLIDERLTSFEIHLYLCMYVVLDAPIHMLIGNDLKLNLCMYVSLVCMPIFYCNKHTKLFFEKFSFLISVVCLFIIVYLLFILGKYANGIQYVNKNSWYAHYKALNSTRQLTETFSCVVRDAHMEYAKT